MAGNQVKRGEYEAGKACTSGKGAESKALGHAKKKKRQPGLMQCEQIYSKRVALAGQKRPKLKS